MQRFNTRHPPSPANSEKTTSLSPTMLKQHLPLQDGFLIFPAFNVSDWLSLVWGNTRWETSVHLGCGWSGTQNQMHLGKNWMINEMNIYILGLFFFWLFTVFLKSCLYHNHDCEKDTLSVFLKRDCRFAHPVVPSCLVKLWRLVSLSYIAMFWTLIHCAVVRASV